MSHVLLVKKENKVLTRAIYRTESMARAIGRTQKMVLSFYRPEKEHRIQVDVQPLTEYLKTL